MIKGKPLSFVLTFTFILATITILAPRGRAVANTTTAAIAVDPTPAPDAWPEANPEIRAPIPITATGVNRLTPSDVKAESSSTAESDDLEFEISALNVVNDGGFEAGTPNPFWTEYSLNFGSPLCTVGTCGTGTGTGPNTGSWWTWFGGIAAYEEGSITQTVTIPNSPTMNLNFYLEQIVCDSAADYMEVTLDGTQVFLTTGNSPLCGTLGYSFQTVDISAFADGGAHTLVFHSENFANNGGISNFFVDDVDIGVNIPSISIDPSSITSAQPADTQVVKTLNITNQGNAELHWSIDESAQTTLLASPGTSQAATSGPLSLILDDGSFESAFRRSGGGQFMWLNRFTPAPSNFPLTLYEIQVLFPNANGINVGELVDIYLYEDSDGDGDPGTGAALRGSIKNAAVQAVDGLTFSSYILSSPVTFNGPGDVNIAVVNRTAGTDDNEFVASFDNTTSQGRSWYGATSSGTIADPPAFPMDSWGVMDSFGFPGNWLVRGFGCTTADIPWLGVSPSSGTLPPSMISGVSVTFDSTGLGGGSYNGHLCVASDDPNNPIVAVPVELVVGTGIDITLSKTDTPDPVCAGDQLTYNLNVSSTGAGTLNNVVLTDDLPAGVSFISATPSQGSCSHASGVVTCNLGSIASGNSAAITLIVNVNGSTSGTITNNASVTSSAGSDNASVNTQAKSCRVYMPTVRSIDASLIFVDTFDMDRGWTVLTQAGGFAGIQAGEYRLSHTSANANVFAIAPLSSADLPGSYEVVAEMRLESGSPESTRFGIIFDWLDLTRLYRFLVSPQEGKYWIYKFDQASGWVVLREGPLTVTPPRYSTFTLKVERDGAQIRVFVNNLVSPLATISDATYTNGQVGLILSAGSTLGSGETAVALFDDFTVRHLP